MENKFNRIEYLKGFITKFLQSKNKARNEVRGNLNLLNRNCNIHNINEKKQILERLDGLFRNPQFIALIQKVKQEKRNIRTRRYAS